MREVNFILYGKRDVKRKEIIAQSREALCLHCKTRISAKAIHNLEQHLQAENHQHLLCWESITMGDKETTKVEWTRKSNNIKDGLVEVQFIVSDSNDSTASKKRKGSLGGYFNFTESKPPKVPKLESKMKDFPDVWATFLALGKIMGGISF